MLKYVLNVQNNDCNINRFMWYHFLFHYRFCHKEDVVEF